MNRVVIVLFGTLSTLSVLVLLFMMYRYANRSDEPYLPVRAKEAAALSKTAQTEKRAAWLGRLATRERPSFSYAVTEMEISLPLVKTPTPTERTRSVQLKEITPFKLFCIRQILDHDGVPYTLYRQNKDGVLILHDLDKKRFRQIVKQLREYDIKI